MSLYIVEELRDQFQRQRAAIRDVLASVPEDQWKAGSTPPLVPARLLYHILSGTEVYARSTSYEAYLLERRFPEDWQLMQADALPDRSTSLACVDVMEKQTVRWLNELADEGLLSSDEGFPWTGSSKLGRALYLLRHTQNHIGELNSELRRRGLARGKWR